MTILETERLRIRPLADADVSNLMDLYCDLRVSRCLANTPHPFTSDNALSFLRKRTPFGSDQRYGFGLDLREDCTFVGFIGVEKVTDGQLQFGYSLLPDFWRQGLMSEAAPCIIRYAFVDLKCPTLTAGCHKDNIGSQAILRRQGFVSAVRRLSSAKL